MIELQPLATPVPALHGTPLVLAVDDDPATLASLKRALAREPYVVMTTEHPKLALRWILRREVNLVISDRRMPEMAGDRFLGQVRRMSPRTSLVMLTAFPEASPGPPFTTVLSKPWDDETLRKTLRRLLKDSLDGAGAGSGDEGEGPEW